MTISGFKKTKLRDISLRETVVKMFILYVVLLSRVQFQVYEELETPLRVMFKIYLICEVSI